jgi:hypothetical protein
MPITALFAQLACTNEAASSDWFEALFDRPSDAKPMPGLSEWHLGSQAGFQLFVDPSAAGHGTMTVFVDDLGAERARLSAAGLPIGDVQHGDAVDILQLRDPDRNLVVLVQPRGGADG